MLQIRDAQRSGQMILSSFASSHPSSQFNEHAFDDKAIRAQDYMADRNHMNDDEEEEEEEDVEEGEDGEGDAEEDAEEGETDENLDKRQSRKFSKSSHTSTSAKARKQHLPQQQQQQQQHPHRDIIRLSYHQEIRAMMYTCGDVREPLDATVECVEQLVRQQLLFLVRTFPVDYAFISQLDFTKFYSVIGKRGCFDDLEAASSSYDRGRHLACAARQ